MKHIGSLLAGICLIIAAVGVAAAQTDKRVAGIRARTLEIDRSGKSYTKTTVDVPGISTEGAEAVIYRSGDEIKKITSAIFGETYKASSEFYFDDGKLIFSYDRVTRYRMPMPLTGPVKVMRIDQIRGYFADGKMFRLMKDKRLVPEGDEEFEGESSRILATVEAILNAEKDAGVADGYDLGSLLGHMR